MKKTCRYLNYPLIMILILSMSINGCILPNQEEEQLPSVTTDAVADISSTLAVCKGTLISAGGSVWVNLPTPGYCWYLNDGGKYKNIYGAMYNWYAVNTGKLCPTGWHVPDNAEWAALAALTGKSKSLHC